MISFTWEQAIHKLPDMQPFGDLTVAEDYPEHLLQTHKAIKELALRCLLDHEQALIEMNTALAFTGSDGRYEKNDDQSPLEILFIYKGDAGANPLIETIREICKCSHIFDSAVEIKNLANPLSAISYEDGSSDFVMPNRGLDANFLIGNSDVFKEYKTQFFESCKTIRPGDLRSYNACFVKRNLKQFESGEGKMRKKEYFHHKVDSSKVKIFYDGAGAKATKYTLLRAIQVVVSKTILKSIKNNSITRSQFEELPFRTIDRLEWLKERGLINSEIGPVEPIQKIYIQALKIQHTSQKLFMSHKVSSGRTSPVSIELPLDIWTPMHSQTATFVENLST